MRSPVYRAAQDLELDLTTLNWTQACETRQDMCVLCRAGSPFPICICTCMQDWIWGVFANVESKLSANIQVGKILLCLHLHMTLMEMRSQRPASTQGWSQSHLFEPHKMTKQTLSSRYIATTQTYMQGCQLKIPMNMPSREPIAAL